MKHLPGVLAAAARYLAVFHAALPYGDRRQATPPYTPTTCNRGVWRGRTFESCGAAIVEGMRCAAHAEVLPS